MKILINDGSKDKRKEVDVEVVYETPTTYRVRLPDGNIITRKKNRDLPKEA